MTESNESQFSQNMAQAQGVENTPGVSRQKRQQNIRKELAEMAQKDPDTISLGEAERDTQRAKELTQELLQIQQELERIEKAKEIMGNDFMGPEQVAAAFNFDPTTIEVPPIPFSAQELERAKQLGQFLILRIDKDNGGNPLTMQRIGIILNDKLKDNGKVFSNLDWQQTEEFFTTDFPKARWALVSKDLLGYENNGQIKDEDEAKVSTNKNYLEQTQVLINYLKNEVFQGGTIPLEYTQAIAEFDQEKASIGAIIESSNGTEWKRAAEMLENLQITQLLRQSSVEALYDLIVYFQITGVRLLSNQYVWTSCRASDGYLVRVGSFWFVGASVSGSEPDSRYDNLGVSFSRSL